VGGVVGSVRSNLMLDGCMVWCGSSVGGRLMIARRFGIELK
jgi:hypothetical protein